jgi:hypothetical protein
MITIDGYVYANELKSLSKKMAFPQTEGETIRFANAKLALDVLERFGKSFCPVKNVIDNYVRVRIIIN